jgi:hypothetical protein
VLGNRETDAPCNAANSKMRKTDRLIKNNSAGINSREQRNLIKDNVLIGIFTLST